MKSIFLSMLAIAALASCTRQEFIDPPAPPKGEERVVELTINSSSLSTKAAGAPTNDNDKGINDLTVFGVNATSGAVITKTYFGTVAEDGVTLGHKLVTFVTTDQTTDIYVIANIGSDLTTTDGSLNVSTLTNLKKAQASLIVPANHAAKQTEGAVLMSGFTPTISNGPVGVGAATATVDLNLIASKIVLKKMTRSANALGAYNADFKFEGVMLTNVQTNAYYFGDGNPLSYIGAISGTPEVRPAITKGFVSGAAIENWGQQKITEFYQDLSQTANFDDTHPINDIAYWYVFENDEAIGAGHTPTALQIHYKWKKNDVDGTPTTDKYLSIIFGNSPIPSLEPGKVYSINLSIDSDFRSTDQGGSGGGGSDDPDQPTISGSVGVTVTPATWVVADEVNKPFQ